MKRLGDRTPPEFRELTTDQSKRYVEEVLADPAFRDASSTKQLAEVMKRSKGSVNPKMVQEHLLRAQRNA